MAFVSVYLGLGSNQGNRLQNLTQALDLLDAAFGPTRGTACRT